MIKTYDELFESKEFQELRETLKHSDENNIFKILKLQNYEIRHSSYLAWLLDPEKLHGLEYSFLKNLLSKIGRSDIKIDKETTLEVYTEYPVSKINEHEKKGRIDIFIKSKNFVCVIENKYGSKEHDKQCKRYIKFVKDKYKNIIKEENLIFIYLDIYPPDKYLFNHGQALEGYKVITYKELLDILPKNLYKHKRKDNKEIANNEILHQYREILSSKYKKFSEDDEVSIEIKNFLIKNDLLNLFLNECKENKNKFEECNTVWTIQSYLWATALTRANDIIENIYERLNNQLRPFNKENEWKIKSGNYGVIRCIPQNCNIENLNFGENIYNPIMFIAISNNLCRDTKDRAKGLNISIEVAGCLKEKSKNKKNLIKTINNKYPNTKKKGWNVIGLQTLKTEKDFFEHILSDNSDDVLIKDCINTIVSSKIIENYTKIVEIFNETPDLM